MVHTYLYPNSRSSPQPPHVQSLCNWRGRELREHPHVDNCPSRHARAMKLAAAAAAIACTNAISGEPEKKQKWKKEKNQCEKSSNHEWYLHTINRDIYFLIFLLVAVVVVGFFPFSVWLIILSIIHALILLCCADTTRKNCNFGFFFQILKPKLGFLNKNMITEKSKFSFQFRTTVKKPNLNISTVHSFP